ncbi:putative bifunctional diguanylate cyclase/phosphodiesterase [Sporomusa malonica]|uniref:Diguanylate cyclase (GGDEF) domain-containing protein n=1 Tax=Sporomusa malonica TaxID=112901 RepID=A0A1W1YX36_9FIRM|nr:GGDEF domain-containing response regulator [Sporomusa malonica]SMC40770.1 diguanylate cyclase (GGDEF) domain-containing protein [Sporomusa malonica]
MAEDLRILLIDDDEVDRIMVRRALKAAHAEIFVDETDNGCEGLCKALSSDYACIFLDHCLPGDSGLAVLSAIRTAGVKTPVIILTGQGDEQLAVDSMKAGATDYLVKGKLTPEILSQGLRAAIRLGRAEAMIEYLSYYDAATGLPNRLLLIDRLVMALSAAEQGSRMLALLFVGVDRFKMVNDTLGHSLGDKLIRVVAERLTKCVGEQTVVTRVGGDVFGILLPGLAGSKTAASIAESMIEEIRQPVDLDGYSWHPAASVGIAVYPDDGQDADMLLKNAESAMYRSKEQGGASYQFYTKSMNANVLERMMLESSLRQALSHNELVVYYQPLIDGTVGCTAGIEALVRWQHPKRGLVPPLDFIPLAEETGLIVPIGEWVLRTACAQNKAWQDAGYPPVVVSVNLSGRQFRQPNFTGMVSQVLIDTGLAPEYLELEITETIALEDVDYTIAILKELGAMGIKIAIDDFGTGYSSLSYLKRFPITTLKIDRIFVKDATQDAQDAAIVSAIIILAHNLNLKVIAEGVETAEQRLFLRERHCNMMQGFLFSRPLPAAQVENMLDRRW